MPRRRLILFTILANALLLLGAELALRLAGFGFTPPDTGYGVRSEPLYALRGGQLVNQLDPKRTFPAERAPGELRIAVIGGSNAANFWGLEAMTGRLTESLRRPVRVLNYGVPSFGSMRELLLMPEILSHRPDILLIYDGHNEFEEDFLLKLRRPAAPLYYLDEALRPLRVYQLLSYGAHRAGALLLRREMSSLAAGKGTLVPLTRRLHQPGIAFDKAEVYRRYDDNLRTIVRLARERRAYVILGTVAYNRLIPGNPVPGVGTFAEAKAAYDRRDFATAKRELEALLDADPEPHRADNKVNEITRAVAAELAVPLVDMDAIAARESPGGIPGPAMLADHCHLTNRAIAIFEDQVARLLESDPRWRKP